MMDTNWTNALGWIQLLVISLPDLISRIEWATTLVIAAACLLIVLLLLAGADRLRLMVHQPHTHSGPMSSSGA